jgi:uncharacterized membrane protein YedE/YeeE
MRGFLIGLLFGSGLVISGMTNPQKVIGFLDLFGDWDPTLLFVMGGAVVTYGILFQIWKRRPKPLFLNKWDIPKKREIDKPLMIGALLFGIGWGLAGFCPGPALVSLGFLKIESLVFVVFLIGGAALHRRAQRSYPL